MSANKPQPLSFLNINALVSFGGAIIIMAIVTKFMHYSWADKVIVFAFTLEAILFVLMGIQKLADKSEDDVVVTHTGNSNSNSPGLDPVIVSKMISTMELLSKNTDANTAIVTALVNELGANHLSKSLKQANGIANLDSSILAVEMDKSVSKYKVLVENIDALNKVYAAQLTAFKSN
jgi:hypothetical protein